MDLNFKTLKKKIKITSNFKGIVGPEDLGAPAHFKYQAQRPRPSKKTFEDD